MENRDTKHLLHQYAVLSPVQDFIESLLPPPQFLNSKNSRTHILPEGAAGHGVRAHISTVLRLHHSGGVGRIYQGGGVVEWGESNAIPLTNPIKWGRAYAHMDKGHSSVGHQAKIEEIETSLWARCLLFHVGVARPYFSVHSLCSLAPSTVFLNTLDPMWHAHLLCNFAFVVFSPPMPKATEQGRPERSLEPLTA